MTKTELISAVALKAELTKKDSEKAVAAVFDAITEALVAGFLMRNKEEFCNAPG